MSAERLWLAQLPVPRVVLRKYRIPLGVAVTTGLRPIAVAH
jgi:hypothetical protein